MIKESYITKKYNGIDHSTFGGIIHTSDFNTGNRIGTNTNGSPLASRVIADRRFDNMCCINVKSRDRQSKYRKGAKQNEQT